MLLALLKDGEGLMEHQTRYFFLRRSLASLKLSAWYYLNKQFLFLENIVLLNEEFSKVCSGAFSEIMGGGSSPQGLCGTDQVAVTLSHWVAEEGSVA